jgi:hypothetical protein
MGGEGQIRDEGAGRWADKAPNMSASCSHSVPYILPRLLDRLIWWSAGQTWAGALLKGKESVASR